MLGSFSFDAIQENYSVRDKQHVVNNIFMQDEVILNPLEELTPIKEQMDYLQFNKTLSYNDHQIFTAYFIPYIAF